MLRVNSYPRLPVCIVKYMEQIYHEIFYLGIVISGFDESYCARGKCGKFGGDSLFLFSA